MKILIIGSVASGKTTLAKLLSNKLKIKYYEMDSIVHDDINKRKRTMKERIEIINKINKKKDWIIEGVASKNTDLLLEDADKIILLDVPINIRRKRIITRFIKQKLGIEKCNYKPTLKILKNMFIWVNEFEEKRQELYKKILKYQNKIIILEKVDNKILNKI